MTKRTSADWQAIVEQQQQSGLSVPVFCQQHGLNKKTFYNRRKSLISGDNRFQSVVLPSLNEDKIVLELENVRLLLPFTCDPSWLAQLLKAVQS